MSTCSRVDADCRVVPRTDAARCFLHAPPAASPQDAVSDTGTLSLNGDERPSALSVASRRKLLQQGGDSSRSRDGSRKARSGATRSGATRPEA